MNKIAIEELGKKLSKWKKKLKTARRTQIK